MKANSKVILTENPLTGNGSISKALKLLTVGQIPRWAKPAEVRKQIPAERWEASKKIVLVRECEGRFTCGVAKTILASPELLTKAGASEEFIAMAEDLEPASPDNRARMVLRFLEEHGFDDAPVWFRPQSEWLTSKFDVVVATHDIAKHFDSQKLGFSVHRVGALNSGKALTILTTDDVPLLKEIYKADYDLFDKLQVWGPEGEVWMVSGPCKSCTDKMRSEMVNAESLGGESPVGSPIEEPVVPDDTKPLTKVKRVRKSKQSRQRG